MKHIAYGMSNPGRVRKQNEDSFLVDELLGLYVVCDGVGGHAAGEVASQTACRVIQQAIMRNRSRLDAYLLKPCPETRKDATKLIQQAISAASREVYQLAVKNPRMRGMATTLVMMVVIGDAAILAYVGDSRIYLHRNDKVHQLTDDHSLSNEQAKRGQSMGSSAKSESLMTRAVGFHSQVQTDTLFIDLIPGDYFLLCSDGASDYFQQGDEFKHFVDNHEVSRIPQKVIDFANESGGKDNVTALVIQMDPVAKVASTDPAKRLQILEQVPIFKGLLYRELLRVIGGIELMEYQPGEKIINEGDKGDAAYVSMTGTLSVMKNGQLITELTPGAFFGEMALVDEAPRSADVVAKEKAQVLIISRDNIFSIVRGDARLAMKLIWSLCRLLSHRLRETSEHLSWARSTLDDSLAGFELLMNGAKATKQAPESKQSPRT